MTDVAPVDARAAPAWLAHHTSQPLHWWLVHPEPGEAKISDTLVKVVGRSQTDGTVWVAWVTGPADHLRYLAEVVGGALEQAPGGSRSRRTVTGMLDAAGCASLLEAGEMAAMDVVLLQVRQTDAAQWLAALRGDGDTGLPAPSLAVRHVVGDKWALGGMVDQFPQLGGPVLDGSETLPEPPPGRAAPRGHRRASLLVVALAGAMAVASVAAAITLRSRNSGTALQAVSGGVPTVRHAPATVPAKPAPAAPATALGARVAYDPVHHQAVLFGGVGQYSDTWVWTPGGVWFLAHPQTSPPGRFAEALAWDPTTNRVLLFGGRLQNGDLPSDTWAWDGTTWTQLSSPATPSPPPGDEFPGLAYDPRFNQMVLVTRRPDSGGAETWVWSAGGWSGPRDLDILPGSSPTMAFDDRTQTVLLLTSAPAGSPGSAVQTWSWDGSGVWRLLPTAHAPPLGFDTGLVRDPVSGQLVLLAQTVPPSSPPAPLQTWSWDGHDWAQLNAVPPNRTSEPVNVAAIVSDSVDSTILAFGSLSLQSTSRFDATWAWTGRTWAWLAGPAGAPLGTGTVPTASAFNSVAYDHRRGQWVLFGGVVSGAGTPTELRQTWTWDGFQWALQHPAAVPPAGGPMTEDPATGTLLLISSPGRLTSSPSPEEMWSWTGSDWRRIGPMPGGFTSPYFLLLLRDDPARGNVVALTGCCLKADGSLASAPASLRFQTWTWNGVTWVRGQPSHQPGAGGFFEFQSMYDSTHGRVLAVASDGNRGEAQTWTWDGSDWTEQHPATAVPVDSVTAVLSDDPSTGSVVLLEDVCSEPITFNRVGGTYSWNGATWIWHDQATAPAVNTAYEAARPIYDAQLGRLILLGSQGPDLSEEWMWTGTTWLQLATG
jgi:hypothetical protein